MTLYVKKRRFNRPHRSRFRKQSGVPENTGYLIDSSISMSWLVAQGDQTKIAMTVKALPLLFHHRRLTRPNDRLAVVTFDHRARLISPLRLPSDPRLVQSLSRIRLDGSTQPETGLQILIPMLAARPVRFRRSIVMLSDGQPTSPYASIYAEVERAAKANIALHTIGVEGQGSDFDAAFLQQLASMTPGGSYSHISSLKALVRVLQHVG